ncbi:MAG: YceI family protein, partial [Candidatus Aenigmarchaeota archaeon]|nr:YceI family protein [Candidatus Aenigmarchaeota archaeon]
SLDDGVSYEFTAKGNLTIKGISKETEFSAKLTLNGGHLSGNASAKIKRSDFGLQIPNVPFVASVGNDVLLFVSFKAVR